MYRGGAVKLSHLYHRTHFPLALLPTHCSVECRVKVSSAESPDLQVARAMGKSTARETETGTAFIPLLQAITNSLHQERRASRSSAGVDDCDVTRSAGLLPAAHVFTASDGSCACNRRQLLGVCRLRASKTTLFKQRQCPNYQEPLWWARGCWILC